MLFKLASLGLVAALSAFQATAQDIRPGVYQIYNTASQSQLRSYPPGQMLYVSQTRENPGPFSLWQIKETESGYTMMNMGLKAYAAASPTTGQALATRRDSDKTTTFAITSAGQGLYNIKVPNVDLLWALDQPGAPVARAILLEANGSPPQMWNFVSEDDVVSVPSQQHVLGQCT